MRIADAAGIQAKGERSVACRPSTLKAGQGRDRLLLGGVARESCSLNSPASARKRAGECCSRVERSRRWRVEVSGPSHNPGASARSRGAASNLDWGKWPLLLLRVNVFDHFNAHPDAGIALEQRLSAPEEAHAGGRQACGGAHQDISPQGRHVSPADCGGLDSIQQQQGGEG